MAQTKPKAAQFYGVSDNGTDGQFLKTDGTGGMSWASTIADPTITSIDYPGTQTAADPAGGESVIINGTLFASGITCTVGGTSAVTAFNSANQITITTPAKVAGSYEVIVTNPNGGTASQANFIQYSGVPVWSTAAGNIGSVQSGSTASFQVTATEGSDTIEYAVTTGTLPTGLSLNTNTGAITGTAPSVSASTTTTFSITATDDENQTSSARSFNITVTPDVPSNHFNTVLYTGTGSNQTISTVGFEPDMVFLQWRNTGNARNPIIFDSVRGVTKYLKTNTTEAQATLSTTLTSFNTNGFSIGSSAALNENNSNWVAWNFKAGGSSTSDSSKDITAEVSANQTAGFSILTYNGATNSTTDTSNNSGNYWTLPHGLSQAPEMIIIKITSGATGPWIVGTSVGGMSFTAGDELRLNTTASKNTQGNLLWGGYNPTATEFKVGGWDVVNRNNYSYVAYCFTSQPGFSKVGSYTGNNVTNNVQTGFEPAFLLIKNISSGYTNNWITVDNKRSPVNQRKQVLSANLNNAESTETVNINFLTNGFQLTNGNSSVNDGSATYIYLAFAADPSTTTPSLANSFDTELYTGNASTNQISTVGFAPDFTWIKARNTATANELHDSVRGEPSRLWANENYAASTAYNGFVKLTSNGFDLNNVGAGGNVNRAYNYVSWNWKAGGLGSINTDGSVTSIVSANQAAGFSVVKWTGTNATNTIGHGLDAIPELILIKPLDQGSTNWQVYAEPIGNDKKLALDTTAAESSTTRFGSTDPTNSVFTFRDVGISGDEIAYCFTSIAGYSKVGTYTGLGSGGPLTVNMGFAPTLGLIKRTNSTGGWRVFDTVRGTDKSLRANVADAEYDDTANYVDFTSTGFYFSTSQANADINAPGGTYIYLAIKEN